MEKAIALEREGKRMEAALSYRHAGTLAMYEGKPTDGKKAFDKAGIPRGGLILILLNTSSFLSGHQDDKRKKTEKVASCLTSANQTAEKEVKGCLFQP